MNLGLFITFLFALQGVYWLIGKRASRKVNSQEDYFLAGKKVSFFPLMMTFLATQVGGGLVLGSADEAFRYGWTVLLYPMGAGLGMICLGLGMGKRLAKFPVSTVAQILEVAYGSALLKKIASILSMVSLFMILIGQIIASHKFLVAIGCPSMILFTLFWLIIILYTVRGGLLAVISTDMAQATVFSLVFGLCFCMILFTGQAPSFTPTLESFAFSSSKLTGWLLLPLLYMIIEQDMGQRCFAGESPKVVSSAAIWAGIGTMAISVVPIVFGVFAKEAGLTVPAGASTLMTAIIYATNPWVAALAGCAILAAIISTATSLINAISSNLSQDFNLVSFFKENSLRATRYLTFAFSVGAVLMAFFCNSVVDVLMQSYELFVSALFVPIFIALFRPKGSFLSALTSIIMGMVGFCYFKVFPINFPSEVVSIVLSLIGFGIGELLARRSRALVR